MTKTCNVYIDGFNFFHGAVRDAPALKWLDFATLSRSMMRGYRIKAVRYYTARVVDEPDDLSKAQRQDDFLRAVASDPLTDVIFGKHVRKKATITTTGSTRSKLPDGTDFTIPRGVRVRGETWEEKGSDVNIGVDLSWDAAMRNMDAALVMSNDSDLQRAIDRALEAGIEVIVINPHQRTTRAPSLRGSDTRKLKRSDLRRAQMPDVVELADGGSVKRPETWS